MSKPFGLRRRLVRVVREEVHVLVHRRVHAELEPLLRRLAEILVREGGREALRADYRDDRRRKRDGGPTGRRVRRRPALVDVFREEDVVLRLVHVERRREHRPAGHDARIADFVRVERRLGEVLVAHGPDRDQIHAGPERRVDQPEGERLGERHVQEIVDDRRRPVGAVVRQAERVVLLRLDQERGPRREHQVRPGSRSGRPARRASSGNDSTGRSRPGRRRRTPCGCRSAAQSRDRTCCAAGCRRR